MNIHSPELGRFLEPLASARDRRYPSISDLAKAQGGWSYKQTVPRSVPQAERDAWTERIRENNMNQLRKVMNAIESGYDNPSSISRFLGRARRSIMVRLEFGIAHGYLSRDYMHRYRVIADTQGAKPGVTQ